LDDTVSETALSRLGVDPIDIFQASAPGSELLRQIMTLWIVPLFDLSRYRYLDASAFLHITLSQGSHKEQKW
jgi:hypothetical protein